MRIFYESLHWFDIFVLVVSVQTVIITHFIFFVYDEGTDPVDHQIVIQQRSANSAVSIRKRVNGFKAQVKIGNDSQKIFRICFVDLVQKIN